MPSQAEMAAMDAITRMAKTLSQINANLIRIADALEKLAALEED